MKKYLFFVIVIFCSEICLAQQKDTVSKTQDVPTAEELYDKAIDYLLGENGVNIDTLKAKELFERSANMGFTRALVDRGCLEKSGAPALVWLKQAAAKDCKYAMYPMYLIYRNGRGVVKDVDEANRWLKIGAELGCPKCQWLLGFNYHYGEEGFPVNVNQAIFWLERASNQNQDEAMEELGEIFQDGILVKRNTNNTLYWYQKAAELNNVIAIERLAEMYLYGDGVAIDEKKAFSLMSEAASLGSATAQGKLGVMYHDGIGCPKNQYAANYWWRTKLNNPKTTQEEKMDLIKLLDE